MTRPSKSDAQLSSRFWSKVDKTPSCWRWVAGHTTDGYGAFQIRNTSHKAHRIAWILSGRELTAGMTIDHLCRVRDCVNPDHLRELTNRENILIGVGPPAINSRKTHCVHGHPFDGDNLIIRPNGNRDCRTCARARGLRHWYRKYRGEAA